MPKTRPEPIRYCLMVLLHPTRQKVVGITKLKGPAHLIGKVTFPGGKIEQGESAASAASREMLEETGVAIPAEAWVPFGAVVTDSYELHRFVAVSEKALHARQLEDEPVWVMDWPHQLVYAERQPAQYAHDFIETMLAALETAGLPASLPEGAMPVL